MSHHLFEGLLRIGDNTLILGQRLSEWCGHAPVLEEDIALANSALDFIGQTQLWLELAADVEGKGRTANELAFLRDAVEFRNVLLVERPNTDFGYTLMRQFLFDVWHFELVKALSTSKNEQIVSIAQKASQEIAYHLERSSDLIVRLGDGSEDSHARMQDALNKLWPYTGELFLEDEVDDVLAQDGLLPSPASLKAGWLSYVERVVREATLTLPESAFMHKGGRQGVHTEHLGFILAEMQFLQRAYPNSNW